MQELALLAELLFLVLFVATLASWVRQRDPISRDLTVIFAGLGLLFVTTLWQRLTGSAAPVAITQAVSVLFLVVQPVATLHLVSLVRHVPRPLIVIAAIAMAALGVPAIYLGTSLPPGVGLAAIVAFAAIELIAAAFLLLEAQRRRGPGAIRLLVAAFGTTSLGLAFLALLVGSATGQGSGGASGGGAASQVAVFLAVGAGVAYVVAFLPPLRLRRFWQSGPSLAYSRRLLARPDAPVAEIWRDFAGLGATVTGSGAVVLTAEGGRDVRAAAASSATARLVGETFPVAEFEALLERTRGPVEQRIETGGPLAARLAAATGARFVSVVPVSASQPTALVLLSPYRSLFHSSDHEVLAALGAQTAIVAERRAIVAEREQLADRLAATVESLRTASNAKSDFLASMSHELRTPLSAILGFSELMRQEEVRDENVVVPLEWVQHIHRGGEHLLTVINDVLDLAKVEAGRLELRPERLDLGQAVAETLNGIRPLAERKRLRLESDIPHVEVDADRGRLRQILYNLLSNAIKYTPAEGTVRVEATPTPSEVRLSVVDTGVGISPEDQALVFEEFRQVGDPRERQEGTGLGLALTRRLVEAHGGRIELESERGRGSRFTVVLPGVATPAVGAAGAPATAPPSREGSTSRPSLRPTPGLEVLVIEDDPSTVRLLREYLEPAGYVVVTAATGESGLSRARERRPAAIVLDVLLPGIDGWEVLRRLKGDPELRDVPVVIVTVVDERELGLALGALDYLVKPIEPDALIGCLARYTLTTKVRERAVRILAVDDEPGGRALIRAALEPEGFEVVDAASGPEALDLVRGDSIDLVVCDLAMPGMDGFEVIAALKRDPSTAEVPIVVCTGRDLSPSDKERLNGQIVGIVTKGADAREGLRGWLARAVPAGGAAGPSAGG
ncbi:MAG TPA: response regulator [Candidatus Limnocylindrales bacterium]|jgi:signal transduction histidine kinase/DNA-binding response OmpR family regulator